MFSKEASFSKKNFVDRNNELFEGVYKPLLNHFERNSSKILETKFGCDLVSEMIKRGGENDKKRIFEIIIKLTQEKENNVLQRISSSRFIKKLVQEQAESPSFAKILFESLSDKHLWAVKQGSSFVILALVESPLTKKQAKKELLPHLKAISKSEQAGAKLIVKALQEK